MFDLRGGIKTSEINKESVPVEQDRSLTIKVGTANGPYLFFVFQNPMVGEGRGPFNISAARAIKKSDLAKWGERQSMRRFRNTGGVRDLGFCSGGLLVAGSRKFSYEKTPDILMDVLEYELRQLLGNDIDIDFVPAGDGDACFACDLCGV